MASVIINEENLTNIANAIRNKNGSTTTYKPSEMAEAINNIAGSGSSENLTDVLNTQNELISTQEVTVDEIIETLRNKAIGASSSLYVKNRIGYVGTYCKSTGYTIQGDLWSDMTPYTGQSSTWYVTEPIEVNSGSNYAYSGFQSANNPAYFFLQEDMVTIIEGAPIKGMLAFTVPENAKYILMSVASANLENAKLTEI